jgi:hypothetical protein
MKRFRVVLIAIGLAMFPAPLQAFDDEPAEAEEAAPDRSADREEAPSEKMPTAEPAPTSREGWALRVGKARERVLVARARLENAEAAYTQMRARNFPRGEERADILKEVEDARQELASAEQALEDLPDEARGADVPPAWLDTD